VNWCVKWIRSSLAGITSSPYIHSSSSLSYPYPIHPLIMSYFLSYLLFGSTSTAVLIGLYLVLTGTIPTPWSELIADASQVKARLSTSAHSWNNHLHMHGLFWVSDCV